MWMDRRLKPGSQPLKNQCRGTGGPLQVHEREKTQRGARERSAALEKTNEDHLFPLSQLKIATQVGTGF